MNFCLSKFDKKILRLMQGQPGQNLISYAELLGISVGILSRRINKLQSSGIILPQVLEIDHQLLGYSIIAFVGINLRGTVNYNKVVAALQRNNRVVRVNMIAGPFCLIIEVMARDQNELTQFLKQLQLIDEIRSTSTFVSLQESFKRSLLL